MKTSREKVSYCIGLETGKNIRQQFVDMDTNLLVEGFSDALKETEPKLKNEEIKQVLMTLRQQMETQQKAFIAKLAEENKKTGLSFLNENKNKEGVVTLPSGLQYKELQAGSGEAPTLTDVVKVHYRGSFIDGRVFDSSYEKGQPIQVPLGRLIPGWTEALQLMKVGSKWKIFVPHYLAYGEMGFGNEIEPNTTLIFELELLGINE